VAITYNTMRAERDDLLAPLSQHQRAVLSTYVWQCADCGHASYHDASGGELDMCDCGGMGNPMKIRVFTLLGGERKDLGTAATFCHCEGSCDESCKKGWGATR
jgi:hypothetical protein